VELLQSRPACEGVRKSRAGSIGCKTGRRRPRARATAPQGGRQPRRAEAEPGGEGNGARCSLEGEVGRLPLQGGAGSGAQCGCEGGVGGREAVAENA